MPLPNRKSVTLCRELLSVSVQHSFFLNDCTALDLADLLHIPARPAGSEGDPLVPNDLLVVDAVVDNTPTSNEELQECRRKLRKARSDLSWLMTAIAGLLKLQIQRSADLAATNRALRQELMELKTTRNTVRSKTRQQLIEEAARLRAHLDRAADEIKQLRECLDNVREAMDFFARAGGFIA